MYVHFVINLVLQANLVLARILHTIRRSPDGSTRFDFYLNRSNQPVAINGVEGKPIIAHRCETDAVGYTLNRNAILIAKTSC